MSTKASEEESHHEESDITDEFIDDDGDKSGYFPGKTITLQMLLGANVLQPGKSAMSIEYLGQKFIGDLLADGKIKSHETETIFCSPSAWAIYCKRIINPDKRSSGCGWASVKYKGRKLDAYKAAYHRKLLQKEKHEDHKDDGGPDVEIIEDTEEDKTAMEPPPIRRSIVQHNTISNRNILHDANTLIETVPFTSAGKIQPFLVSVSTSTILLMDFHCHLTTNEVCGYLGGTWDINAHNLSITHAFPCRNSRYDRDKAAMCELQIQKLMVKKNLNLVGWYHSHPRFPVQPTLRDCDAQLEYQIKMRGPTEASYTPCVGFICSPYNDDNNALESSILSFWVLPPPENRPAEYGRPMMMSYSLVQDETLSEDIKEEMMLTVDYYKQFKRELINFQNVYKNEVSFIDKLKKTLHPKLPLDSRSGHFWNWIRELLGLDPEEIVVIPDPPPPPAPISIPKLPEPISAPMVVNLTGTDEGCSVTTEAKNDDDFDGVSEMGDSDVISLKDDDNKAVSLGVPSLQAQLKRPSGLNMTPSPLSSALVTLPANLSQTGGNPPPAPNANNNHGGSITTNTSSPRDSPITIPSNSASPAKFEIPVRASPSPAKSDTSSCRSRNTRNSPAPSPVKLSIGDILGSGSRNSPTLSSLIGNMGGNVSNIHDLYAATFASLGTSIPSNLLSQDYASLFQNTKRDEYGLSALNALAQVAAASGISNNQINETLLHSLNRSISSGGKSNQTSTITTSSATMSSSTAPSASSSSSSSAAAAAAAAAAAVASSTGLPQIPNMKEFMQQLEKGNLSLLMQSQYANPLAGMTGLTGQAGGGSTGGKSGSSRSGKSRSKAAQQQQQQQQQQQSVQQQLQQAQQQLLQQQQQQHQSLMDYADFTSKFDQGKLADLMKSPEYSQMLMQQAQALGSLGSEISIIKKPSSKGSNSNANNSGNNNSGNNNNSAGNNSQSSNKKDSASDLITKLRTVFSTDSYLPPMPTANDINLLADQSQKVPEIQQILNSGNLDDIQVLLKAQSLSNNTLDFALFMQGTSGSNAGGSGEGSSKASKSAAAKEEREREKEREREQRERDNANAAAAAAAAAAMNPYLSASNLSALFEPVQRPEKSGGKSGKNKGGNSQNQLNNSNPADMLNSLFTSAGTSAADMNALLYGQGKGAPDLSMLFGGVSSAPTTSSNSSTTSTSAAAAAAAAAKQSLDYLSMFPNFSAAKLPEMSALFQSDKFEIPDPLAKATLEANNMYLAPSASLLKLQQEAFNSMMMKPPKSSSSSTSSSSKIETPPPIVASPGARSTPTKSANRDSPSLSGPKYNFSAVDLAVSSVPLAASSPLGGVADLSRKTPQTPPVDMSGSPSIQTTPPVGAGGSASGSQILPPYKKRMEFSSIADLVAAPPSKMPKLATENLDP